MTTTVEELEAALAGVQHPPAPVDGDGLTWAPVVAATLAEAGFPVRPTTVAAWLNYERRELLFLHPVTAVDDLIVDFTANQFTLRDPVPHRWITPIDEYAEKFAASTGAAKVTFVEATTTINPAEVI